MNVEKEFYRIMATQTDVALATCTASIPNVRIVNFIFDDESKLIYFTTFEDNEKVKEFESNEVVAFTTIPHIGNEHVRARGTVRKSSRTIMELAEVFGEKIEGYTDTIEQVGEFLVVYEISFARASVILSYKSADVIEF